MLMFPVMMSPRSSAVKYRQLGASDSLFIHNLQTRLLIRGENRRSRNLTKDWWSQYLVRDQCRKLFIKEKSGRSHVKKHLHSTTSSPHLKNWGDNITLRNKKTVTINPSWGVRRVKEETGPWYLAKVTEAHKVLIIPINKRYILKLLGASTSAKKIRSKDATCHYYYYSRKKNII